MTSTEEKDSNESGCPSIEPQLSPMQQAIKARAIAIIENQGNQPSFSVRRKLAFAALSIMTVVGLIFLINYGVAIMQHIFELWAQDDPPVIAPLKPGEPFYITVEPPRATTAHSNQVGDKKEENN